MAQVSASTEGDLSQGLSSAQHRVLSCQQLNPARF